MLSCTSLIRMRRFCRHPSFFCVSGNGEGLYDLIAMNAAKAIRSSNCFSYFLCVPISSKQRPSPTAAASRAHMQKAQEHLREKRPDLLFLNSNSEFSLDPDNVNARANLGVLLFFQGDYANAAPHLRSSDCAAARFGGEFRRF